MNFSYKFKKLRSGNSYDLGTQQEMSVHEEEATREVETGTVAGNEENSIIFSPISVEKGIKSRLEPLKAQISALIEIMDRLIQSNSVKDTTTSSSRETRHQ